ncbi:hypothetical protein O181_007143 [Austropuccinia psidii MF-1]|uniref:Uncharacterized protein n=1 Tax=Austropuccinia psidii MF-1 TaxID=1389203 RepID=A0A9Q3BLT9_9BASI|nr:hypothetical protein [Austropuccinia psidii MF-1]
MGLFSIFHSRSSHNSKFSSRPTPSQVIPPSLQLHHPLQRQAGSNRPELEPNGRRASENFSYRSGSSSPQSYDAPYKNSRRTIDELFSPVLERQTEEAIEPEEIIRKMCLKIPQPSKRNSGIDNTLHSTTQAPFSLGGKSVKALELAHTTTESQIPKLHPRDLLESNGPVFRVPCQKNEFKDHEIKKSQIKSRASYHPDFGQGSQSQKFNGLESLRISRSISQNISIAKSLRRSFCLTGSRTSLQIDCESETLMQPSDNESQKYDYSRNKLQDQQNNLNDIPPDLAGHSDPIITSTDDAGSTKLAEKDRSSKAVEGDVLFSICQPSDSSNQKLEPVLHKLERPGPDGTLNTIWEVRLEPSKSICADPKT